MVLEDVFKELSWENKGLNIQGERLNNLRFADDIAIFAQTEEELSEMLIQIRNKSNTVVLKTNYQKTKYMTNENTDRNTINMGEHTVEKVETYTYLGHNK